jgi:MYXO-CTERM domain-containing protein
VTSTGISSSASISNTDWPSTALTNAPAASTGNYPTDQFLNISFTQPVYDVSFTYSNWGDNSFAPSGGSNYTAYGPSNGHLLSQLGRGSLSSVDNKSLVTLAVVGGITDLEISNGFVDTFSPGSERSWEFGVSSLSFDTSPVSAVPLPPALPIFATALVALGAFAWRRRRQIA